MTHTPEPMHEARCDAPPEQKDDYRTSDDLDLRDKHITEIRAPWPEAHSARHWPSSLQRLWLGQFKQRCVHITAYPRFQNVTVDFEMIDVVEPGSCSNS